jgi:hypothetical protein
MVRLSSFAMNNIEKSTGMDIRPFFNDDCRKSSRDFHYSEKEIRAYYERIHAQCKQQGIQFTTCYIGNGENMFWADQDLWDNKKDCCNAQNRVKGFTTDARKIDYETRSQLSSIKMPAINPSAINLELGNVNLKEILLQYKNPEGDLLQ